MYAGWLVLEMISSGNNNNNKLTATADCSIRAWGKYFMITNAVQEISILLDKIDLEFDNVKNVNIVYWTC